MHHHNTVPDPVDSRTRTYCGGIGRHTRNCQPPPLPAGAVDGSEFDSVDTRVVLGRRLVVPGGASVRAAAIQRRTGAICDDPSEERPSVHLDADGDLTPDAARLLARHLGAAADQAERWGCEAAKDRHPAGRLRAIEGGALMDTINPAVSDVSRRAGSSVGYSRELIIRRSRVQGRPTPEQQRIASADA